MILFFVFFWSNKKIFHLFPGLYQKTYPPNIQIKFICHSIFLLKKPFFVCEWIFSLFWKSHSFANEIFSLFWKSHSLFANEIFSLINFYDVTVLTYRPFDNSFSFSTLHIHWKTASNYETGCRRNELDINKERERKNLTLNWLFTPNSPKN